jgi:carboxyl-terminal processing protease
MRLLLTFTLLLLTAPAFAQQARDDDGQTVASSDDPNAAETVPERVPLEEIQRFVGVFNLVRGAYVEPVDDKRLMQAAVRGLLLDLDPHSEYLEKDDADDFDEEATGAYGGIGVNVQTQPDGTLLVVSPLDDTPAARAGIKSGDVIVAIDGKLLMGNTGDSMAPLRGEPGSKVKLSIMRDDADKPFEVELVREDIHIASVRSRMLEPGYGYIRISVFQADTGAEFQKQLEQLQTKAKLRGLVLDLRSNPGGLLTVAVQIADDLLDSGVIVSTRGRVPSSDSEFKATPGDRLNGAPLVVLVDAGSASASEVLAGALRDNQRARIVGSRTFGKGSVQTTLPLGNGDMIKLTTARYYTPSGKSIQASGIVPDVVLKPSGKSEPMPIDYSEAALPGHLHGDEEGAEGYVIGDVLDGDEYITQALAELKQPGSVAAAQKKVEAAKK